MKEIIGQGIGILAVMITFASYQAKARKTVLVLSTAATVAMLVHYFLIEALSGCVLNAVCVVRNLIYLQKERRFFSSPLVPYALAVLMVAVGAIFWQGLPTLLTLSGLAINTVFLSREPQTLRKSILLTSTLILIYNIIVFSIGGILNESVALCSAVIGILRFRKRDAVRGDGRCAALSVHSPSNDGQK